MIRRLFWLALGATVGILIVRLLSRAAEALTPTSIGNALARAAADVAAGFRVFAEDVRDGMAERESELRQALGLDAAENG
jgi:hypothetical protein